MKTTEVAEVFDTIKPVLQELVREAPQDRGAVPRGAVPAGAPARVRGADPRDARLRGRRVATRHDRAPVLHVVLDARRPPHDALPRAGHRVALVDDARGRPRPVRARDLEVARAHPARRRARRSASTSRRAARGRTSSGAAAPFWSYWYEPLQATFPDQLGDVDLETFLAAINRAEPGLHPRRGGRDDVQPPHHPALRHRAAAHGGDARPEGPAGGMERGDARAPRRRGARTTRRASSRTSTGRAAASATSRRTRSATSSRSRSGPSSARRSPTSTRRWRRASSKALSAWLRDNLYSLGRKLTPKETIERLTGAPRIDPQPYLAYLREKLSALPAGA